VSACQILSGGKGMVRSTNIERRAAVFSVIRPFLWCVPKTKEVIRPSLSSIRVHLNVGHASRNVGSGPFRSSPTRP
jgi:hypothetical protein